MPRSIASTLWYADANYACEGNVALTLQGPHTLDDCCGDCFSGLDGHVQLCVSVPSSDLHTMTDANNRFDGRVVGKLPFVPFSYLQGSTHTEYHGILICSISNFPPLSAGRGLHRQLVHLHLCAIDDVSALGMVILMLVTH